MNNNKNTPKAIFFDLDGTLLEHGRLTKSGEQAVHYAKAKGALVFVATGRNKWEVDCMKWIPDLPFDGFVTMNGTYSYVGDKVLFKKTIHNDAVAIAAKHIADTCQYSLFCEADTTYASYMNEGKMEELLGYNVPIPAVRDPIASIGTDIYQIVLFGEQINMAILDLPHCAVTSWAEGCYDIIAKGVNKWVGIQPVLAHFGLTAQDTAAVGDGTNDIEMLIGAGHSVAMGNAYDKVKACAGYVTGHVNDGGALEAVKYLLG